MSATTFRLASSGRDDAALSELASSTNGGDSVATQISFPSGFCNGVTHLGDDVEIIVGERDGQFVAMATRALYSHVVNGSQQGGGYLSDLRVKESERRGLILEKGFRFLRERHTDGRAEIYTTVINEDNERALCTLTSARASLPLYTDVGRVLVYAVAGLTPEADYMYVEPPVHRGTIALLPRLIDYINTSPLQFSRRYRSDTLLETLSGLRAEDFYFTFDSASRIIGALAVWDQRTIRQLKIASYPPLLEIFRQVSRNALGLPRPGEVLRLGHLGLTSTLTGEAFKALLRRACRELRQRGLDAFLLSLHERDPRNHVMDQFICTRHGLRMFAVTFGGPPMLDNRVPQFDISFV